MSASIDFAKSLKNPLNEIRLIRSGLKPKDIESFLSQENFPVKDFLERLHIPASTYFSRKSSRKPLDAHSSEKFIRLISIILLGYQILGKEETRSWIYKKIPSLGNEVPLDLLDTEAGHRLVEQALLQIKYGIYG